MFLFLPPIFVQFTCVFICFGLIVNFIFLLIIDWDFKTLCLLLLPIDYNLNQAMCCVCEAVLGF